MVISLQNKIHDLVLYRLAISGLVLHTLGKKKRKKTTATHKQLVHLGLSVQTSPDMNI